MYEYACLEASATKTSNTPEAARAVRMYRQHPADGRAVRMYKLHPADGRAVRMYKQYPADDRAVRMYGQHPADDTAVRMYGQHPADAERSVRETVELNILMWLSAPENRIERTTVVPPYPRVIRSKTYCGYVKPRIIPNAIYNVTFV
jgi:hypothetical protein